MAGTVRIISLELIKMIFGNFRRVRRYVSPLTYAQNAVSSLHLFY